MSGQSPNSQNIGQVAAGVANSTSIVVHPEYRYWRLEWRKLRDVIAGQREVKRQTELYLKGMKGQDQEDYTAYLERATFYNMTGQTLNGMLGQVFLREPILVNLPKQFKETVRLSFSKDGASHVNFCKTVVSEQIGMGRFGVLVDAPAAGSITPTSYVVGYAAENIMDWTVEEINGTYKLTRVLVREFAREVYNGPDQQNPWIGAEPTPAGRKRAQYTQNFNSNGGRSRIVEPVGRFVQSYTYRTLYRELVLERQDDGSFVYKQNVYNQDPYGTPYQQFVPTIRGQTLDFIPFKFFGATSNTADVEKPPLLDIADLNLSHYRTYAELEWGRMYTALPVYYAPGKDNEGVAQYHIGPNVVWEVPANEKPGILEYTGQGLKALETALDSKEKQIAAIGGRLMPGAHRGGESPGQTLLREAGEVALILNVIQATESGMAEVVRWWLMWRDVPLTQSENLEYTMSRDFLANPIGARELRAIQMMYSDGLLPVDVFYSYLVKADVIDATMALDEFTALLDDPESFVNNPDAQARQRGFATRQQELDQATVAREADLQQQEIDLEERQVVMEENAPPPKIVAPSAPAPTGANPQRAQGPKPARPAVKTKKKPRGA